MEGRPSAVARDVLDHTSQRVTADEQRERLVLVGRPRHELMEEEDRCHRHHAGDGGLERVNPGKTRAHAGSLYRQRL
jgi:hypothetical protein